MNADRFRRLFDYHITLNRKVWARGISALTDEQFVRDLPYSVGSIRNQIVHVMSVDQRWFAGLQKMTVPDFLDPSAFPDRAAIRVQWDTIENAMQDYLIGLRDVHLQEPFLEDVIVWEVLFHVLNHGTDHRAQVLAMLNQLGVPSFPQDYFFFARGIEV